MESLLFCDSPQSVFDVFLQANYQGFFFWFMEFNGKINILQFIPIISKTMGIPEPRLFFYGFKCWDFIDSFLFHLRLVQSQRSSCQYGLFLRLQKQFLFLFYQLTEPVHYSLSYVL